VDLIKALLSAYPEQSPRRKGALPSYLLDEPSRNWVNSSWDEVKNDTARVVAPMNGVSTRIGSIDENNGMYKLIPQFDQGDYSGFFTARKRQKNSSYPSSPSLIDLLSTENRLHEDYLAPQADYWYARRGL
jgi:hypothetical protein